MSGRCPTLLVLGLGNILCRDDGLGVAAVVRIARGWESPAQAHVLDGGTLGLALLGYLADADDAILVDAVAAASPPGTLVRLAGEAVGPAIRERLSVHQIGVDDLLAGAALLGRMPRRIVLLGIVPETISLGVERSAVVEASLPALCERVIDEARALGHRFVPRPAPESHETDRPDGPNQNEARPPGSGGDGTRALGL